MPAMLQEILESLATVHVFMYGYNLADRICLM